MGRRPTPRIRDANVTRKPGKLEEYAYFGETRRIVADSVYLMNNNLLSSKSTII